MTHKPTSSVLCLLLAGFLLQTAIPVGYMPANINDGWFVKLCPQGMSADVMAAVLGEHHHHHHDEDEASFLQCDLGGVIGAVLLQNNTEQDQIPFTNLAATATTDLVYTGTNRGLWIRPRAPPVTRIALTFS